MQGKGAALLTFLGYVAIIAVVTFGVSYVLKNMNANTPLAESTPIVENSSGPSSEVKNNTKMQEEVTELKIEDIKVGTGAEAVNGKEVTVNYTGTLTDGTKFDSSLNPGRSPFSFNLGNDNVIEGWHKGVVGMKVGGKRILTIPSSLGYGPDGNPPVIPPSATLIFEIELLDVK